MPRKEKVEIMVETKETVKNALGLHIKPAGELSNIALQYSCNVYLRIREYDVNAKSLLGILSAQVKCGEEITIVCNGDQEEECLAAISAACRNGFGME